MRIVSWTTNMWNIIMALCLMMFLLSCNSHKEEASLFSYQGKYPDESAQNITITMSDSGTVSFVVSTPILNRYYLDTINYIDCPEGIKIVSYTEWGEKQAVITADYAICENNSVYRATRNVTICDVIKGDTLETEEIIWDQRTRTIYSNVLVKQKKADGSVNYGDGFTADERFTRYTIFHPRGEMNGFEF